MIVEQLQSSEAARKEILIRSEYVECNGASADTRGDPKLLCLQVRHVCFVFCFFTKISFAVESYFGAWTS